MAQPPQDHRQYIPSPQGVPLPQSAPPGMVPIHISQYPPHSYAAIPPRGPAPTMLRASSPKPQSYQDGKGRKYTLTVVQEPVRARMCGFGDKDRRPITPPPCILLTITDIATGNPIDISDLDVSYFVLSVELWTQDGTLEVNLVRHSATSPSISATTASSYPPPPPQPITHAFGPPLTHTIGGGGYGQAYQPYHQVVGPNYPHQAYPANISGGPPVPGVFYPPPPPPAPMSSNGVMPTQDPRGAPQGMFTRNLIGSLAVTAQKLTDLNSKMGIWFILQDLSVRTEGSFRLRMSLTDIGASAISGIEGGSINRGEAPILATTFSKDFQVYSAKKFPGVIESTALSKCFATQGVKIPIRKDGPSKGQEDED